MKLTSVKRTVVAGAAALTLVGASLGVVGAQQAPADPGRPAPSQQQGDRQQRHQQFIAALAAKLGITPDQLQQAMDQTRTDLGIQGHGPDGGGRGAGGGLHAGAQALGVSVDQLRRELRGQTLTQVAQAHNVDPATVANALKQAADARIDQEVAAGRIPADQVDAARQRAAERVDQLMTQTGPAERGPAGREPRSGAPGAGR